MRSLILASASPRRKDILEFLGIPFTIAVSDFPEEDLSWSQFDDPGDFVLSLAMGKALMVAPKHTDALVLAADTDVFIDDQVIGKPRDLDHARKILKQLRGRVHRVVTGVVLLDTLTLERAVVTSEAVVEFLPFSDEQLENYIATSEPMGKAGGYAIQLGSRGFVKSVSGSVSGIVGLPLRETADLLEAFDVPIEVDIEAIVDEHFSFRQ